MPASPSCSLFGTKQELFWQSIIIHPCNVTKPPEVSVLQQINNPGHSTPDSHIIIKNFVHQCDTPNTS